MALAVPQPPPSLATTLHHPQLTSPLNQPPPVLQLTALANTAICTTFVVPMVVKLVTERVAAPTRPQSTLLYLFVQLAGVCQPVMVESLARSTQPLTVVQPPPTPA